MDLEPFPDAPKGALQVNSAKDLDNFLEKIVVATHGRAVDTDQAA
jgi:hypothetical protein